jgi:quercetin dioxygenase-like cupin family protein
MPFHKWEALPDEVISPHYSTATGGTVTGAIIEVGRYRMSGGTGADPHKHPNEQIIYVLKGRLHARVGDEEQVVLAGEVVHVPPNVVHEIRALEDSQFLSSKNLVEGKGSRGWSAAARVDRPRATMSSKRVDERRATMSSKRMDKRTASARRPRRASAARVPARKTRRASRTRARR